MEDSVKKENGTDRKNRIVIPGCGGFIGSHILRRLLTKTEFFVTGIDRSSSRITDLLGHSRLNFIEADIYSDSENLRNIISTSSVVISLAALCNPSLYTSIPVEVIESNFVKPYQLIQLCSENNVWLIHFSTCEVYGKTKAALFSDGSCNGLRDSGAFNEDTSQMIVGPVSAQRWCYAVAKQLYERALFAWGSENRLKYTIIRPFNFIGPDMDYIPGIDGEGTPRVLACFMKALLTKTPLKLVDGGMSRRSFTYIDDAVDAIVAVLKHPDASRNQIFNIGNPANELSIKELAHLMISIYKDLYGAGENGLTVENVSSREFYGAGYEDCDRRIPDISNALRQLGWHPETNLEIALRKTVQAYVNKYSGF
ncbi:MAG: bifunctional UDP-4-keto-pentose/UDP-xylose synthase [Chitinispirillaceae bacterium]|nr:bifunctional UDP-4-keto-pentose/UDP-xylose synthase [Chitinispirillaceae bacterium]